MLDKDQIDEWASSEQYWSETPESYPTPLEMTKHYQQVTGQKPDYFLYSELIQEEYEEWYNYCPSGVGHVPDPTEEELKELADLVYVIYGYANARGWDLDEALYRVHISNMGRMRQDDGNIKYREDGKIIKNPNAPKCDLSDLV